MRLLAECFAHNPVFQHAFPDDSSRAFALRAIFKAVLDDALRFGRAEAAFADEIVGILLWYPPGAYPMPLWRDLLGLASYLQIALRAPLGLFRLYRLQSTLDAIRPQQPHCHGYFLASRTGARTGVILGRRMLEEADSRGWPTYLETQDSRTVTLYLRLGFRIVGGTVTAGMRTWTMWRDPRHACTA